MEAKFQQLSRSKELAFMGKITAGLSHEIKNTLAIINESAGLMGDLLNREPPLDWEPYPRVKSIGLSIEEQVQRSAVIVKRLNRFAHSMDKPLTTVDVNELVQEITALAQRFARLRGVELEVQPAPESLQILSDPFRVQYVTFAFIERALHCSPKQAKVTVSCSRTGEMALVTITDAGLPEAESIRKQISTALSSRSWVNDEKNLELAILATTMSALGGSIGAEELGETGNKIVLSFPAQFPER